MTLPRMLNYMFNNQMPPICYMFAELSGGSGRFCNYVFYFFGKRHLLRRMYFGWVYRRTGGVSQPPNLYVVDVKQIDTSEYIRE